MDYENFLEMIHAKDATSFNNRLKTYSIEDIKCLLSLTVGYTKVKLGYTNCDDYNEKKFNLKYLMNCMIREIRNKEFKIIDSYDEQIKQASTKEEKELLYILRDRDITSFRTSIENILKPK